MRVMLECPDLGAQIAEALGELSSSDAVSTLKEMWSRPIRRSLNRSSAGVPGSGSRSTTTVPPTRSRHRLPSLSTGTPSASS